MEDIQDYKIGLKKLTKILDNDLNREREEIKKNSRYLWLMGIMRDATDGYEIAFAGGKTSEIKTMFKELSKVNNNIDFNEDEMKVKYNKKIFTVSCGVDLKKMIKDQHKILNNISKISYEIHKK